MRAKKFIIPFVLASLAGHALLLTLTTRINWETGTQPERVMNVELKAPPEMETPAAAPLIAATPPSTGGAGGGAFREDSVSLQGKPGRYGTYLLMIRRKIEQLWSYPPQALSKQQEGDAVIRFTINANGSLSGYRVMATSGSSVLDEGALAVVRAAAPYAPLPAGFRLSRLHITAIFSYRMNP